MNLGVLFIKNRSKDKTINLTKLVSYNLLIISIIYIVEVIDLNFIIFFLKINKKI